MSDDLEKFLQRAAQRRRQRAEPSIVIIDEQNADVVHPEIVEPEIVEPEMVRRPLGSQSVGDHVHEHLDHSGFEQRAERLGDRVESADDKMSQHIHDVFDHQVGRLHSQFVDDPNSISDDPPPTDVQPNWIVDMLRNPATLRQVIVLNEIMTPAFRRQQR